MEKSKEYNSHLKIYITIWIIVILILTGMYFTDYKKWILPVGFVYWIWIIIMGNYEIFRFRNLLKNYYPLLFEEYLNGFYRQIKILYFNDIVDDDKLIKARKYLKIVMLFIILQVLTIPIIAILVDIIKQFI